MYVDLSGCVHHAQGSREAVMNQFAHGFICAAGLTRLNWSDAAIYVIIWLEV